jgi:hypothetical protein
MHKHVGWRLDRWTATRIRVSAIWKQHPEFSAKQLIEVPRTEVPRASEVDSARNTSVCVGLYEAKYEALSDRTTVLSGLAQSSVGARQAPQAAISTGPRLPVSVNRRQFALMNH